MDLIAHIPKQILSDRGAQFISQVWRAFFQWLGIAISLFLGYHPESNGQAEHSIQELSRHLQAYCSSQQHEWVCYPVWVEYAQNSMRHVATGLTPLECVLGHQSPLCPWYTTPTDIPAIDEWFCSAEKVWEGAHSNIRHTVHCFIRYCLRQEALNYKVKDRVWLSTKDLHLSLPSKKLSPWFIGPFAITSIVNPVSVEH